MHKRQWRDCTCGRARASGARRLQILRRLRRSRSAPRRRRQRRRSAGEPRRRQRRPAYDGAQAPPAPATASTSATAATTTTTPSSMWAMERGGAWAECARSAPRRRRRQRRRRRRRRLRCATGASARARRSSARARRLPARRRIHRRRGPRTPNAPQWAACATSKGGVDARQYCRLATYERGASAPRSSSAGLASDRHDLAAHGCREPKPGTVREAPRCGTGGGDPRLRDDSRCSRCRRRRGRSSRGR